MWSGEGTYQPVNLSCWAGFSQSHYQTGGGSLLSARCPRSWTGTFVSQGAWAGGGDENKTGHLYPGIQCHFLILHRSRRCVGHLEWPVNYSSFYGFTSPNLSWSSSQVSLYGSRSGGKVDIQYFVECHCLEELPRFSWRPTAFVTREGSGMSRLLEGNKKYSATGNACLRLAGFVKWASADKKHFSLTARMSMELDPRSEKANCVSPPCRLACRHFEV